MGQTVDSKVVEMRFDNSNFEKNIAQSMQSLRNIENQLSSLSGSRGLENLSSEAKKVDFSNISKGIEDVKVHFSGMQVAGATAMSELTKKAMNLGKSLISNTIGQIKNGGLTRALNIEQAKFQIEGLGKTWSKVVNGVEKGVKADVDYAVQDTAYGLDEAAKVASQLLASGIKLGKEMKYSLRGISGVAAMTNSEYSEMGNIFTKVAGNGRVMAQELMQISAHGLNAAATIKKYLNNNDKARKSAIQQALASGKNTKRIQAFAKATKLTEQNVRELVTAGGISFKIFAKAMDKAFGPHAKKANETYEGSLKNLKAALSRVGEGFQTPKLHAMRDIFNAITGAIKKAHETMKPFIEEFGKGVESSGKKIASFITNFGKRFDKASVSMEDWVKISGYGEKKTNALGKAIYNVAKAQGIDLDKMIKKHGSFGETLKEGWLKLDIFKKALDSYNEKTGKTGKSTQKLVKSTKLSFKELDKVSNDVIKGNFGNGLERIKALTKAGYEYNAVQGLVNHKLIGTKFNFEQYAKSLDKASEKQLKHQGYTKEEIKALKELQKESERTGTPLNELMEKLSKPTTFEATVNLLFTLVGSLKKLVMSFGEAFAEVFFGGEPSESSGLAEFLTGLAEAIKITDEKAENFKNTFKGVFAVLDIVRMILMGPINLIFKVIGKVLENFDTNLSVVTGSIGEMLVALRDWYKESSPMAQILDIIATVLATVIGLVVKLASSISNLFMNAFAKPMKGIKEFLNIIKTTGKIDLNPLKNGFKDFGKNVSKIFDSVTEKVRNFLTSRHLVSGGVFDSIIDKAKEVFNFLKDGFNAIKEKLSEVFGGKEAKKAEQVIDTANKVKDTLNGNIVDEKKLKKKGFAFDGFLGKIKSGLSSFFGWFAGFFKGMNVYTVAGIGTLVAAFTALFMILSIISRLVTPVQRALMIVNTVRSTLFQVKQNLKVNKVLKLAVVIGILAFAIFQIAKLPAERVLFAAGVLIAFATGLVILAKNAEKLKVEKVDALIMMMLGISASILILAVALGRISDLVEKGTMWQSIGGLAIMLTALTALIVAIGKLAPKIEIGAKQIIAISVSILILTLALKRLDKLKIDNVPALIGKIVLVLGMLVAVFAATKLLGENAKGAAASILISSISLLILVTVLKRLDNLELNNIFKTIGNMILAIGMLGLLMLETKILGEHAKGAGLTILSMSVSLLLLAVVIERIAAIKTQDIKKGVLTIAALSAIIGGLIVLSQLTSVSNGKTIALTLISVAAALAVMAGLVAFVGSMPIGQVAKGTAFILAFGVMIGALIFVTSKIESYKGVAVLITVLASIALLANVVRQLAMLDTAKVITATSCIVALGVMVGVLMATTSKIDAKAFAAVGAILGIIIVLSAAIYIIASMKKVDKALAVMLLMTPLLIALSVAMAICSFIHPEAAALGIASFAIFVGGLTALLVALGAIQQIPGLSWIVSEGGKLLVKIGSILGSFVGAIVKGFIVQASESLPVLGKNLSLFMKNLQGFISGLEQIDGDSMKKAAQLMGVIAVFLAEATWNDILAGLEHIMSFFGVSEDKLGFEGMANGIKAMGEGLASFATATESVDTGSVDKSVEVLTKLTESLENIGDADIDAEDLLMFIAGIQTFAEALKTILPQFSSIADQFTDEQIDSMDKIASILESFTKAMDNIPNTGGIAQDFTGENDYSGFANGIQAISEAIKSVRDSFEDLTDGDVERVNHVIKLIAGFAEAADEVPNTGGIAQAFAGENDYGYFASGIQAISEAIRSVRDNFKDLTDGDVERVNHVIDLIAAFAKAVDEIPNTGGIAQAFTGQEDYGYFASGIGAISEAIRSVRDNFEDLSNKDVERVNQVVKLIAAFANSMDEVPNTGGVAQWFTGEEDYTGFSEGINKIGAAILEIKDQFVSISEEDFAKLQSIMDMIVDITKVADNIPDTSALQDWVTGDEDYDGFANGITKLGSAIIKIGEIEMDEDTIANAQTILGLITKAINTFKKIQDVADGLNGDFLDNLVGVEVDYEGFATGVQNIVDSIKSVRDKFVDVSEEDFTRVNTVIGLVDGFVKALDKVPKTDKFTEWFSGDEDYEGFTTGITQISAAILNVKTQFEDLSDDDISRVEQLVNMIVKICDIGDKIPDTSLLEEMFTGDEDYTGFSNGITQLGNAILTIGQTPVDTGTFESADLLLELIDRCSGMFNKIQTMAKSLSSAAATAPPDSTDAANIKTYLSNIKTNLLDADLSADTTNIDAFITSVNGVISKISILAADIAAIDTGKVTDVIATLEVLGDTLSGGFIDSINNVVPKVIPSLSSMMNSIGGYCKMYAPILYSDMSAVGSYAIKGFCAGVNNMAPTAEVTAKNVMSRFVAAARSKLQVASPSKVFFKLGKFTIDGYIMGVDKHREKAIKSVRGGFNKIIKAAQKELVAGGKSLSALAKIYYTDHGKNSKKFVSMLSQKMQNAAYHLYTKSDEYQDDKKTAQSLKRRLKWDKKHLTKHYKKYYKKYNKLEEKISKAKTKKRRKSLEKDAKKYKKGHDQYEKAKEDKKQLKKDQKELQKTVQSNIAKTWNELANTIKDNAKSFLDPLSNAIDTGIELFTRFERGQRISASRMLGNMRSQIKAAADYASDVDKLEALKGKGLSESLIKKLKDKGISGWQEVKSFLNMTPEQLKEASAYDAAETKLSFSTMMKGLMDRIKVAQDWNTKISNLSKRGLDRDVLAALLKMGIDEAGPYIDALTAASDAQLKKFNSEYKRALKLESSLSADAMASLANAEDAKGKKKKKKGKKKTKKVDKTYKAAGKATAKNLVDGIVKGLDEYSKDAEKASTKLGSAIINAINKRLKIKSPSGEGEDSGMYTVLGLARGIMGNLKIAQNAGDELAETILDPLKQMEDTQESIGTTPTINPVLDLRQLKHDLNELSNMFKNEYMLDIAANMSGKGGLAYQSTKSGDIINNYNNNFEQNNYSPEPLDRTGIYRDTKGWINSKMKGGVVTT